MTDEKPLEEGAGSCSPTRRSTGSRGRLFGFLNNIIAYLKEAPRWSKSALLFRAWLVGVRRWQGAMPLREYRWGQVADFKMSNEKLPPRGWTPMRLSNSATL